MPPPQRDNGISSLMTRRKLLYSFFAAPLVYPCYWEPRWLDVTHRHVRLPDFRPAHPFRILHLADLHASIFVPLSLIDHAITLGLAAKPDLICLTGDFVTLREGFDPAMYALVLRRLSSAAPSFAVLGNHDGGNWARYHHGFENHDPVDRVLEEAGIQLLHNRSIRVIAAGSPVTLAGVGDLWSHEVRGAHAFAGVNEDAPVILLAHNPDTKDRLRHFPWHLMLSGHTHGGQILVPFEGPRYAPVVDKRYVAGLHAWGARQIYVTRGVGNLGGVRFRCRPEVSILTIG
jgi:predicted MPP superfamily phosphohydrolase